MKEPETNCKGEEKEGRTETACKVVKDAGETETETCLEATEPVQSETETGCKEDAKTEKTTCSQATESETETGRKEDFFKTGTDARRKTDRKESEKKCKETEKIEKATDIKIFNEADEQETETERECHMIEKAGKEDTKHCLFSPVIVSDSSDVKIPDAKAVSSYHHHSFPNSNQHNSHCHHCVLFAQRL